MGKQIMFKSDAYKDIENIGEYYFGVNEELKLRFENELFAFLERMAANPITFKIYKKNYRAVSLDIFPFMIFYKEDSNSILVVAIIHKKRGERFISSKIQ